MAYDAPGYTARCRLTPPCRDWAGAAASAVVRLTYGHRYATGFLTNLERIRLAIETGTLPDAVAQPAPLVIFARHSLPAAAGRTIRVTAGTGRFTIAAAVAIPHTDIAVGILGDDPVTGVVLPALGMGGRFLGSEAINLGFGGTADHSPDTLTPQVGRARMIAHLPFAVSRDTGIRIRHAGVVASPSTMRNGDSGGPVIIRNQVVGVQSMLLNLGRLQLSSISLIGPHLVPIIRAAVHLTGTHAAA
ncbi:hypothetical protein ACFSSC_03570 [Corynebacterium mendelii]|uniref:Serine protease n=1 Tax=Corynebacterium mendelii TaxID=2765362 RepID=A0A939E119_9CORY|nr:hypothetical protein [Corynebacterium mendelii]MBN9643517.1 hypothetical protein [Corynebacterium mendelii]